jgi:putative ABC transport system permease protein
VVDVRSLDKKLLRDLLRLWGQILAIALIVACGIAMFVAMQSNYESLKLSQANYYNQYRFAQVFASLKRAPETIVEHIQEIPGVAQVQTRVLMDVTLDVKGRSEPVIGRLISIPEQQSPMLNDLYIRQGRYIEANRRDEVLVSEAFAQANRLQLEDTVGAVINGRWQRLRIVGFALSPEYIYEIRGGDVFPDNQRFGVFWMGREALGNALNMDGAFNDVALTLLPKTNPAEVIFRLDQLLKPYGGVGAIAREDQTSNRFVSDEIVQLQGHAKIVPTIFLGIGAFLLHIVLTRLISTQRDQIAVLKAFGYSNWAIGRHFLKFVLAIVFLGAVIGTGFGLWLGKSLTQLYGQFYHFPILRYQVSSATIAGAVAISLGAALLGAFGAVQRAVAMPPAEAMRPEPPAQFRRTLMERLGLQALLSPVGRIILRNLERKPLQSIFSIIGIALAVALLVSGRYSQDVTQYLIDVQFNTIQREDAMVTFIEPRPARTRYEVAQLPGVLYAEPFRAVAAQLRFGHRSHKVGILGLKPAGELRHLVDRQLQDVDLPLDGILLSTKLAEILNIQPEQTLTVDVLEGKRPLLKIPVAGLVDELVGLSAYMDIQALNRLMQEGETISGAFLAVDEMQLDPLYKQLKQTPAVASVTLRKAAIAQFQKTIAESQGVVTGIQVIFACIIAFGVVYNSARISLSERSRELATLRIIGFSRPQIAMILLGEQAALTLVAIPVGCAMGYGIAAMLSNLLDTELYRFPLVVRNTSYGFAVVVVLLAAAISGAMIRRNLNRLDLVAVLKTRE